MITVHGTLYSTKNHMRILNRKDGSPFIMKSKLSKAQENPLLLQLQAQQSRFRTMTTGKEYPYRLVMKMYRPTKRRFDYVNIVQGLLDLMVKAGYFTDDSADFIIPHFEPYEIDKVNPRVEVWLG